ncbi:EamA family transporter [Pectinatus haikarae]|uniref:Multidrug transporter EmrE-like cation transporter n=1 Tax=Pectinatus haikarae TaxID=349096 RepID=A0ABT9Y443_9FIRM|nr:EamA family transporter [Pectinatus haikarae]MDQ0202594.1 multidrug transporter EmrE-like cation transporter [Pectinatus haikarae]
MINFIMILIGVMLNAAAQLFLKKGMLVIGKVQISFDSIIVALPKICLNYHIWSGLTCYVISVLVWLVVLSRVEVSYAYPFLSIGYIVTAFIGYYFLGESMNLYKISGIIVICLGILLLYKA